MILEFFYFYFILWIGFIYNSITIYLVIKSLKNVGITSEEQSWVFKLRFYPLILISFISSFLNLLKNIIYNGRFDTLLEILSLLPFITVLAFCLYLIFIFQ